MDIAAYLARHGMPVIYGSQIQVSVTRTLDGQLQILVFDTFTGRPIEVVTDVAGDGAEFMPANSKELRAAGAEALRKLAEMWEDL